MKITTPVSLKDTPLGAPKDPDKRREFYRRRDAKRRARRQADPAFDALVKQKHRERSARRHAALRPLREKARAEREAAKAAAKAAAAAAREAVKAEKRAARQERRRLARKKFKAVRSARKRAVEKGVPFGIRASDLTWPEVCPILGLKLDYGKWDGATMDNRPSLDRIVPAKGYVRGNVQVISNRANTLKGNATPAELRKLADYMEMFHG